MNTEIFLKNTKGKLIPFSSYKNKVLLVVNVASYCEHTHQYSQLVKLKNSLGDKEFEILAFPCNQFANQEPDDISFIEDICINKYNINFDLFDKIEVNGENIHPLYKYLLEKTPCDFKVNDIKWNFTKFLVDKNLNPIKRFNPNEMPMDLMADIGKYLP
jgi:glutathione peroxidase